MSLQIGIFQYIPTLSHFFIVLKNTMTKIKNSVESFNSSVKKAKGTICKVENRCLDIIQSDEKKEIRIKKSIESLCELCNSFKQNIIMAVAKEEEIEKDKNLFQKNNGWKLPKSGERYGHQIT